MMRHEFALEVGESFVVEHPCGLKHTVINIEGIEADAGEVEMLLQTWEKSTLVQSRRVTLAKSQLGSLAGILDQSAVDKQPEILSESSSLSGFDWRR